MRISLRSRIAGVFALLVLCNVGAWLWAAGALHGRPLLLGTAALAYGFGLRHAVDADHIAAIDNVTRKLMADGKQPVTVGFFFALGHSSVVLLATMAIIVTAGLLAGHFDGLARVGDVLGTLMSAIFLFGIALMNLAILRDLWSAWRRVRAGEAHDDGAIEALLAQRGALTRLLRPLFRLISASWHMLVVGFLFGLGFDTASEVGLLGMSAAEASHGLPLGSVLVFPALFAAGMSLVDTADGVLMLGAYRWAYVQPTRKLAYNLVVTAVSVAVALLIGGIETAGLLGDKCNLHGWIWRVAGTAANHFGQIGTAVIAILLITWAVSLVVSRVRDASAARP